MISRRHIIGITLFLLIIVAIILFTGIPDSDEKLKPRDVPKELTDPCVGKEEGDICVVEDFSGSEESFCGYMDDTLVCFPHRMPPNGGDMDEKMLEACDDKDEGDSCTIVGPMGEENGICTPRYDGLFCMVERTD